MVNFEYLVPTKIVFGKETEKEAGRLIKEFGGHKALIHWGGDYVRDTGLLARVEEGLAAEGIEYVEMDGVVPNPRLSLVKQGVELCKKEGVDFVLAIGGGSAIDSSKAIAYGLANDFDLEDLFLGKVSTTKIAKIGAISTLAGTGSETSNSTVINIDTMGEKMLKRSYNHECARPLFAIMNPELTYSLPPFQTAAPGADIMMHTMERYFTNGGNMELTDVLAEGLLRTVMKNAVILHTDPANYEARAEVMWAGSLSHNGLTGCGIASGDFMSHKLEHEMGGMFDVTHGAGLAALWPSWARYVYKDCLPRFVRFARNVMGVTTDGTDEEIALKGIDAMVDFYHSIGMPASFHELGIDPTDAQIDEMARRCLEASGSALGSAKKLDLDDMVAIYRAANH